MFYPDRSQLFSSFVVVVGVVDFRRLFSLFPHFSRMAACPLREGFINVEPVFFGGRSPRLWPEGYGFKAGS